jgi:hypothetical protein
MLRVEDYSCGVMTYTSDNIPQVYDLPIASVHLPFLNDAFPYIRQFEIRPCIGCTLTSVLALVDRSSSTLTDISPVTSWNSIPKYQKMNGC